MLNPISDFQVRAVGPYDRKWVEDFLNEHWGGETVVAHGMVFHPREPPGFIVICERQPVGFVTYSTNGGRS